MWPLLLCSLLSLTVVLERVIFWWKESGKRNLKLIEDIFALTEKGDFEAAYALKAENPDLTARVFMSGLAHRDHGLSEIMTIAAEEGIARMKRGLDVLDTIITLAPLLGILGTVIGIIESFDLLGKSGIENPKAVIGGIAQALITTAAGLTIAIISLIPFNTLTSKIQKTTKGLENDATRFEVAYKKGLEARNKKIKL